MVADDRLQRAYAIPPLVPPLYDDEEDMEERQVYIPRMGKDLKTDEERFVPPLPRLGKLLDDYMKEYRRQLTDETTRQVFANIPRVGRSKRSAGQVDSRAVPLPRMGYRDAEYEAVRRAAPLPRLGLFTRAALPRLGLRQEDDDIYWGEEVGGSDDNIVNEIRAAPLPRLGLMDKKAVGMLRMGRNSPDQAEDTSKRAMNMLRMGKRALSMLRMGKRPVSMLRMGRDANKRAVGMLRMGKRDTPEDSKRAMNMLRMGRSSNADNENSVHSDVDMQRDARAVGMLRMGRSMRMLRMGKRPVSMLRMGKRQVRMLRMGKRSAGETTNESLSEKATDGSDASA